MTLLAHSAGGERREQTYGDHVRGVVEKVQADLAAIAPYLSEENAGQYRAILASAAEYHDLGKLNEENQKVLHGEKRAGRLPVEHRDAGVKLLLGDEAERPAATLVYAHHRPGLPDIPAQKTAGAPFRFPAAMADSEAHLQDYLTLHAQAAGGPKGAKENTQQKLSALGYRFLLSCLVDADYSDTGGGTHPLPQPRWEERRRKLDQYVEGLARKSGCPQSPQNRLRREFYESCRNAPTGQEITCCDSPVGTGKTTAVLAYMLKTAQEAGLRRIFIVLPYTNIISQTVAVLREAIVLDGEDGQEIVAEHHHQADFESPRLRRLAAAWTAPIVVTTAVQFFETLAGNLPARLRKLHQLPGSGIILDEYHAALPVKHMLPAWKWLTELAGSWGCRICMCSATAVRFWDEPAFQKLSRQRAAPILPQAVSEALGAFERSRVALGAWSGTIHGFEGAAALAAHIGSFHGSKIVVLNTVQSAAAFAKYLRESGVDTLHLSSALTPEDKEKTIGEVRGRLDPEHPQKEDWVLVATSCVECGLNLSFHYGFCELRSLAAYLQLAGRVRRYHEKRYEDAFLDVFKVVDDAFSANRAFEASAQIFSNMIGAGELPALTTAQAVTSAFRKEVQISGQLSEAVCKEEQQKQFSTVAKEFRVIDEATITAVASPRLAERLRCGEKISPRELQRGSVEIPLSVCKKLGLPEEELPVLDCTQYDSFLGYRKSLV